ncbi:MAG: hypothetical protein IJY27_04405 [Clostridia bacterium]|nr:hypothetical protein [Clostridia bacterium]
MKTNRKAISRLAVLSAIFCLACFIFGIRLFALQVVSRDKYAPAIAAKTLTREVTIKAQRGDICDRDGTPLATNTYTYDLVIDYYSLPPTVREENESILALLAECERNGASAIVCDGYPLAGSYPDMYFVPGTEEMRQSIIDHYYLKDSVDAKAMAKYLANRYDLLDDDGELICTPAEALSIMHVRWSMIADGFYDSGVYTLAENVTRELVVSVNESNIRGGMIETVSTRTYTYPGYASHILGQLGRIYAEDWEEYKAKGYSMDAMVGISGCEDVFEDYLRGQDGVMVYEYDKQGNLLNKYVKTEPVAGHDVWLTIDIETQVAAEDGLRDNIAYIKAHATGGLTGEDVSAGAFCMVDVDTGEVLAMASYPTYDLTTYNDDYEMLSQAEVTPLTNRAINGLYAPGSTFKPGVAVAALDAGLITTQTIINTTGRYTYFSSYQPRCWYYISTGRSHGPINVSEAIRVSCNCFFYEVGRLLGIERMNDYCVKFGLGQETGFELGGETGILAGPEYREAAGLAAWQETDTIVAAIGQSENLFSPLQINMYFAALGNGGTRYRATLLHSVHEFYTDETVVEVAAPTVMSSFNITSADHASLLASLRSVVTTSGTLTNTFRSVPVTVSGKTGTAQVGTTKSENALFAALAPANNPEVAAVCVIEQGHAGSYSARTVAAAFEAYFDQ